MSDLAITLDPNRTYAANRFRGTCANCGNAVGVKEGVVTNEAGKWYTLHRGQCPPANVRLNGYAQACEMCRREVPPGMGTLERSDAGKWAVYHLGGCVTEFPFPDGRYAIETPHGVRFYHCTEGDVYVMASDNEHLIAPAEAKGVVEQIAKDSLAAAKLYGIEFEQCGVCGRGLTSDWRKVGIGPVCAEKGWG